MSRDGRSAEIRRFDGPEALAARAGECLGISEWNEVTDQQVVDFCAATVDAGQDGVPPWLLLSLLPGLLKQIYLVDGLRMNLNYGTQQVRHLQAVPVGRRIRAAATLVEARPHRLGLRFTIRGEIEAEGLDGPACIADAMIVMAR